MRQIAALLLVSTVILTGCKEEPPPPPEDVPPPPPSAQEILQEFKSAAQPLYQGAQGQIFLTPGMRKEAAESLRPVLGKHGANPNRGEAVSMFKGELDRLIRQARDNEQWHAVDGIAMAYKVIAPQDDRHVKLQQRAKLILARPEVTCTGSIETEGQLYVFFDVQDGRKIQRFRVREGEEFHEDKNGQPDLKLNRIIGNLQAIELDYLPINESWEIPGP